MMKWIAAFVGYLLFRFPGAVLGFIVGSLLENLNRAKGGNRRTFRSTTRSTVTPADFELNLLSLCSIVIKADGQASQRELDYVRHYFLSTYGKEKANAIFRTFNEVIKKRTLSAQQICVYLAQRTSYEIRLQLLHFLFGIAQADGQVSQAEVNKLRSIAGHLRVGIYDFESIKAMFFEAADQAYTILEVSKDATNADIKKAYRKMAKKYHPDRVVTQDEAIQKGAEEKFKEVQKAYETIQKERGIS